MIFANILIELWNYITFEWCNTLATANNNSLQPEKKTTINTMNEQTQLKQIHACVLTKMDHTDKARNIERWNYLWRMLHKDTHTHTKTLTKTHVHVMTKDWSSWQDNTIKRWTSLWYVAHKQTNKHMQQIHTHSPPAYRWVNFTVHTPRKMKIFAACFTLTNTHTHI